MSQAAALVQTDTQDLVEFDKLKAEADLIAKRFQSVTVTDDTSNTLAAEGIRQLRVLINRIEERRLEATRPLLERKRAIDDYAEEISGPLETAQKHVKAAIAAHGRIVEEARQAAAKKLEAERVERERKRAEEERKRREAEDRELAAKRKAIEDEAAAKKAAAQKEAERASRRTQLFGAKPAVDPDAALKATEAEAERVRQEKEAELEKERLANQAKADRERKAEEKQFKADARAIEQTKVKNIRKVPQYKVEDPEKLPRKYLTVDTAAIYRDVQSGVREIPGVKIWEEDQVIAR